MIKGLGFSKYLKLFLIGFGISFFMGFVGNSVNAVNISQLFPVSIDKTPSNPDQNYKVGILNKARFNTMYLGTVINTMTLDNTFSVFWANQNGVSNLYYINTDSTTYSSLKNSQGFFQYYYSCDKIDINTTGDFLTGCGIPMHYEPGDEIITNFLSKIQINTDYVYVYSRAASEVYQPIYILDVCFSSSELNSTLCFYGRFNSSYPFSGSLNIPYDYSFLTLRNYASESPGMGSGMGNLDGAEGVDINSNITGDYQYTSCTYGDIINQLESDGMSKYLCYGGLDNFSLYDSNTVYNPIPGSGLRLSQILAHFQAQEWDTPTDWFNFWNGIYQNRYVNPNLNWWRSYPAVYRTYFDLYYQYGGDLFVFDVVREYCNMTVDLNIDRDTVYNGTYFSSYCTWIQEGGYDGHDYAHVGSGNVNGTNWNGVGNISGSVPTSQIGFMQDMFNKIKSTVNTNNFTGGLGFLPKYIMLFLLALILFRFLSH